MRCLFDEDASSLTRPGRAPSPRVVVGLAAEPSHHERSAIDFAEPAFFYDLPGNPCPTERAHLIHNGELTAGDLGCSYHLIRCRDGDTDGLLGKNVDSALKSLDRNGRMIVMRCSDDDGVHESAVEQLNGISEAGNSKFRTRLGLNVGPNVADSRKTRFFYVLHA